MSEKNQYRPVLTEETRSLIEELQHLWKTGAKDHPRLEPNAIIKLACQCLKVHLDDVIAGTFITSAEEME